MALTFRAPRDFFESTYVPHICLVYGTRENIAFLSTPLKGAQLLSMPAIPLPYSPRAIRDQTSRFGWTGPVAILLCALAALAIVGSVDPIFYCAGFAAFGLLTTLMYFLQRKTQPGPLPRCHWVDLADTQGVQIVFPATWESVFHEFEDALARWRARPAGQANPPPPPDHIAADPLDDDEWPDAAAGEWDQAKKS